MGRQLAFGFKGTLFSIFIAAVLELIRDQLPQGITINYRTDGGIFNLRRLSARTKISVTSVIELQYADDNAVCALTERELQLILNTFAGAYSRLGLTVNVRKTQIVYQPAPNEPREQVPSIEIGGESLEVVDRLLTWVATYRQISALKMKFSIA